MPALQVQQQEQLQRALPVSALGLIELRQTNQRPPQALKQPKLQFKQNGYFTETWKPVSRGESELFLDTVPNS